MVPISHFKLIIMICILILVSYVSLESFGVQEQQTWTPVGFSIGVVGTLRNKFKFLVTFGFISIIESFFCKI